MNNYFIIINYNDVNNCINLINKVKNYKVINKIIVVDNKSTDNSADLLTNIISKNVYVIFNEDNIGYAAAINKGVKYINDELGGGNVFISNTDIDVDSEDDLIKLIDNLNDPNVSAVMPTVKENGHLKRGWKLTSSFIDLICDIPLINRLYKSSLTNYKESYFKDDISIVDVVYGAFFLIKSRDLQHIDYLEESTFLYFEEYILARKLKRVNKKLLINNKVYVHHKHNATIGNNVTKLNKYKIYKKSEFIYEKKYNRANPIEMFFYKLFYLLTLPKYKIKLLFKK